ncbi:MAG: family 1 encapsulin nanocompartment shell protein [Thermotogota bacterium]
MANLKRHIAPISQQAWDFIDEEARRILKLKLTARKVVDFVGPKGMDFAAVNTGRKIPIEDTPLEGVKYSKRQVLPMVEIEVPFNLKMDEIESLVRGAEDVETDSLIEAAEKIAKAENRAIFNGLSHANIKGILPISENDHIKVDDDLVTPVAEGVKVLEDQGIEGPFNLIVGDKLRSLLYKPNEKGYPAKRRLENLLEGSIIFAPDLEDKGLILPVNSEDFEFIVGQDVSVGYSHQEGNELVFFFIESFTFRVNAPEACVVLE